jgi:XTP/dITP diphosphohydrolase
MEGEIAMEPMGESGFGYDPIFWLPPYQRTVAQLGFEEKMRISHRSKAVAKLKAALPAFLGG